MNISSQDWSTIPATKRPYNDAFMHACNATSWAEPEKRRMLSVLSAYELGPISLVDSDGIETNALVQRELLPKGEQQCSVSSVAQPSRMPDSTKGLAMLDASLYATITGGPYRHKLLEHQFMELNDELGQMLNSDWLDKPSLRFACSRLLSGMVLLHSAKGIAIVAHTIEVYARKRDLDAHRESFRAHATNSSLPPPDKTRYRHVWPTTIFDTDGKKLVLGTKTFNALITSSLRIDTKTEPDVGPSTNAILLEPYDDSMATKIFIKKSSWTAAMALAEREHVHALTSYDLLAQLRQVRTRFHQESTYLRCRFSDDTTDDLTRRPYTIFTLSSWDHGADGSDYRIASKLFREVARLIFTRPSANHTAMLQKTFVSELANNSKKNHTLANTMKRILALFDDNDEIAIIGNLSLNTEQKVAASLAPTLSKANESIRAAILATYEK